MVRATRKRRKGSGDGRFMVNDVVLRVGFVVSILEIKEVGGCERVGRKMRFFLAEVLCGVD
jgi:hypothetical protein